MLQHTAYNNQRGFSLIEVLISVVLLSVGLLGNLAVQSFTSKSSSNMAYRNVAIALASELQGAIVSDYTSATCYATSGLTDPCTNTNASDYFTEWKSRVEALPGSMAPKVEFYPDPTGSNSLYTITIEWRVSLNANDADLSLSSYKLSSRLDNSL